jgi:hypothetical protein
MDWSQLHQNDLNEKGFTIIPSVLSREECEHCNWSYTMINYLYRNTIDMKRYRFGRGGVQILQLSRYLQPYMQVLREAFYKPLL